MKDLLPYLDAANIDLKSFSDSIYQRICGGHLQPVLDTILALRDMDMIREMCRWMVENDLANNPLHFSRFFPRFKMQDTDPPPLHILKEAREIALEVGVRNVYLGNV